MAATSSPSPSNTSTDTASAAITPTTTSIAAAFSMSPNAPKTLRGLNKPKCIRCGNVARSRCPYQSCKSCCSKAQNPCHIHVLKAIATEATATASSPVVVKHSTEVPLSVSSHRVSSLKQLSNNFAQFNNLQIPLSKKPLTKKEAAAINKWRFSKLKEYKEGNVESENEAFDRYMHNISLLEEVFTESSLDESTDNNESLASQEDKSKQFISGIKLKLKSNSVRSYNFRKRIYEAVNNGLEKVRKGTLSDDVDGSDFVNSSKRRNKRILDLTDLNEKLNKARNEEDLKSCMEMKIRIFSQDLKKGEKETENIDVLEEKNAKKEVPGQESAYSLPKLVRATEIDDKTLNGIDVHFLSLDQIEDL